jgi:hypothetical protein
LPTIEGTDGPDKLVGTNSDDRILGLKGDDRIVSRNGDDFMTGGAGADHYVFDQQDGTDTITDFTPWGSPPECDGSELCIALAVPLDRIVLKGGTPRPTSRPQSRVSSRTARATPSFTTARPTLF